ncbi:hypothetical protein [Mobiluncus mulieris]|uniref:hypothetical protein n=1 Tax=Mobiluncus mulieris TaxID=2052 RepID=UPI0021E304D5|nr:hypothetical protein [Mobiluncus mulieris]
MHQLRQYRNLAAFSTLMARFDVLRLLNRAKRPNQELNRLQYPVFSGCVVNLLFGVPNSSGFAASPNQAQNL